MAKSIYWTSLALLALAGCDAPGNDALDENNAAAAPAEAEEGRLSVKGAGIDFSIQVPEGLQERARVDGDNKLMPPGASVAGIRIQGDAPNEAAQGSVSLRFRTQQSPEQVAAWYRDAARAPDLRNVEARREGAEIVIGGRTGDSGDGRFTVHLAAAGSGGGTDGRLTLIDGN